MKKLFEASTRDIAYLDPVMRGKIPDFLEEVKQSGISIIITCTARLAQAQMALYAQGRQSLDEINRLRKIVNLYTLGPAEAKKKVTNTLLSKHLVNFDNWDPNDDYSQAFDFAIMSGKKADYNLKVNVNKNQIPDYEEVGIIAESYGWEWGGRWKNFPDYPHIQKRKT